MKTIRVHVRRRPSPASTYYEGYVEITVDEDVDISDLADMLRRAVQELKRTSFPETSFLEWKITDIERMQRK